MAIAWSEWNIHVRCPSTMPGMQGGWGGDSNSLLIPILLKAIVDLCTNNLCQSF